MIGERTSEQIPIWDKARQGFVRECDAERQKHPAQMARLQQVADEVGQLVGVYPLLHRCDTVNCGNFDAAGLEWWADVLECALHFTRACQARCSEVPVREVFAYGLLAGTMGVFHVVEDVAVRSLIHTAEDCQVLNKTLVQPLKSLLVE